MKGDDETAPAKPGCSLTTLVTLVVVVVLVGLLALTSFPGESRLLER